HADVVGSTALVQRNETLAHERIRDAFGRFAEDIHAYGGVAHEIRGDALVAEFARASDAVCAALRFQQSNTVHNALMGDETVPVVRVGIALGEEVIAHDTITGAGVVLAQRVEQLAEPGGVCVTAAIQEALPRRMPFEEEGLGEQELKGLEKPVRVYRVRLTPGEAVPEPEASGRGRSASWRPRLVAAVATVAAIIAGAAVLWLEPWATREEPASVERMAFPLPDKPSIAVLPFDNMSGDPEQEYFSDGLTENIITTLSRLPGVFVIARNSTFTYKGQAVKVQRVAEELGVRYVLEGSFQRAKNQIRVHAQFIDALTGRHLWAERFDRQWSDVFALQDDITEKIVSALELELTEEEKARLARRYTTSVAAYDHFLQAQALLFRLTEGGRQEAREQLQQAIRLDPDFARAYGALAYTYFRAAESEFFGSYSEQAYERALELAQTAVEKDASLPQPHGVLAEILTRTDPEQAAAPPRERQSSWTRITVMRMSSSRSAAPMGAMQTKQRRWSRRLCGSTPIRLLAIISHEAGPCFLPGASPKRFRC
ncbi:MAG: tetratricopeptide repeat protein, partial [Gammaproteobacteria bacterium]|nr:tetratricopeptide repeat protein [Gammaproteobacteria bacterium]NIW87060.1 tetratricopeptide repeat protein [Gammaproteobacteria bacterium]